MNAILKIGGQEYEVLQMHYSFDYLTDRKGRPCSDIGGGSIELTVVSTDSNSLLYNMTEDPWSSSSGEVIIYGFSEDGLPLRRIQFEQAWIYRFEESMEAETYKPMVIRLAITPLLMKIGKNIDIHRVWPESIMGTWEKVVKKKEEWEKAPVKQEKKVKKIYWSYGSDFKELNYLSRYYNDLNLHISTQGYEDGDYVTIKLKKDDGKPLKGNTMEMDVQGKVKNNEAIVEDIFKNQIINLKSN